VNFQVADATKLEGLDNRFDTVVDSAFYHVHTEGCRASTPKRYTPGHQAGGTAVSV